MNYREVEIMPLAVVGDSGTETIDLDVTDPITELVVYIKVKNGTSIIEDAPPEGIISKIEIVDGGQVWWSASGAQAMAVATYEKGRWPTTWLYEGPNGNQRTWIPIQFGRFVGDEQYGFNPNLLSNPQLKVTWSKNAGHLTNQVELGILAKLMQGVGAPSQALMTKIIRDFTTASSGEEPTDLPVDLPYRRLFYGAVLAGYSITSHFSNYKLDCDLGKLIVWDLAYREMHALCENEFGFFTYRKHDFVDSQRYVRTWMGRTMAAQIQSSGGSQILNAYTTSSDNYYVSAYSHDNVQQTDLSVVAHVTGSIPQGLICYQFGRKDEPITWFDPRVFKKVQLKLTQSLADAAASILLQQPVTLRRA